jgi:tetratricopeptide (TPR) repeat protein
VAIYGDLGAPSKAELVAKDYAAWMTENLERVGLSADTLGPELASLNLALGDAFDRNGQRDKALEIFERGLAALDDVSPSRWADGLRAQLEFNIGGQIAKQGRHAEAEAAYKKAERDMAVLGWDEPVVRARHARHFARWKQGHRDGLYEEFLAIAEEYERLLTAAASAAGEIVARQGLDLAYRMLLRLRVDTVDLDDPFDVHLLLLLLFVLKEEEGKFVRLSRAVAERPAAHAHSEITVLVERLAHRPSSALLIIEQVPEALLFVTFRGGA